VELGDEGFASGFPFRTEPRDRRLALFQRRADDFDERELLRRVVKRGLLIRRHVDDVLRQDGKVMPQPQVVLHGLEELGHVVGHGVPGANGHLQRVPQRLAHDAKLVNVDRLFTFGGPADDARVATELVDEIVNLLCQPRAGRVDHARQLLSHGPPTAKFFHQINVVDLVQQLAAELGLPLRELLSQKIDALLRQRAADELLKMQLHHVQIAHRPEPLAKPSRKAREHAKPLGVDERFEQIKTGLEPSRGDARLMNRRRVEILNHLREQLPKGLDLFIEKTNEMVRLADLHGHSVTVLRAKS